MNPGVARCLLRGILLLFTLVGLAHGEQKTIHLRNGVIRAKSRGQTTQVSATNETISGLFLIQFTGPVHADWREILAVQHAELLRYVPDDAFVVRFKNVRLRQIEALPFIRSIEDYRAEYKVHLGLAKHARVNAPPHLQIKMLLAPDAMPQELAQIRGLLHKVEHETPLRRGHILQGTVTPAQLNALAQSASVLWIEPAPRMRLFDEIASKITGGDDGASGTGTVTQQLGYDGTGVSVAVADSGLHEGEAATMHPDLAGRVDAFFAYGMLTDAADEHSHGTHVTGIIAGNAATGEKDDAGFLYGLGVAPGAHIVAQRIFDGVGNYEAPPGFEVLTHDAVRAGAEIGSNSWGDDTQGRYDLSAAEFDALVRDADAGTTGDQPYILEFSAGNAGPGIQTIGSPAVAKNVIATGATENNRFDFYIYDSGQETMADFSSRGPCEDGRIKPDVVAPGTWISSLRSSLANDDNAWAPISNNYLYQGGTSQAGPHVSGAAAVFVQYYRETVTNTTPSPALVKAALINSAVDMDDGTGDTTVIPNNDEGWGRVDLTQIIDSDRRFEFVDQTVVLTNSQIFERRLLIASPDEPLKVTLTYTDVPGFPATIPALVNDLDLEVVSPNGDVFHGNQFIDGESVPNAGTADTVNNVEQVYVGAPVAGEYLIRVRASRVVEDARDDSAAVDQDFALAASGDIPMPGAGILVLDRQAYRAQDTLKLTLIDADLSGQTSAIITISSSTETNGETYILFPLRPGGVFTGSVMTATGFATNDGRVQISHNDTITAQYQDASPTGTRSATARADFLSPVISNVSATNRFGKTVVVWDTDEPADSVVRYGTNSILSASVTNRTLTVQHQVIVDGFVPGQTYQFLVVSRDEAGNATTNDNGGLLFSVTAQPAATVLLVDAYTAVPPDYGATVPVTAYTDALAQSGVTYEVWNTSQYGSPGTNDLLPFRVVMWRINDNVFSDNTLTTVQQNTLKAFVDGGGSLFISSMELLTRIGTNATALTFRADVLNVSSFLEDAMVPSVDGIDNDPTSSGISVDLDYSAYDSDILQLLGVDPDVADTITLTTNASAIFLESASGRTAGLRHPRTGQDAAGRVVFLPFPLDAVPTTGADPNNRANLLRNIIGFLAPGVNGLGTIALDSSSYTIPALTTVEVADLDLAGSGQTTVTFLSDTATNAQSITLNETTRPGLFRGYVTLVGATNAFQPGELRVQNGDVITAEYFDISANGVVQVVAIVDTIAAIITNVAVIPDYQEALVSWTTSKPTDALVQFGESTFLGRTAYLSELDDAHSVTLRGLEPDRFYYYQVVSRDLAGNTTTDDNNGNYHTFRTLQPLLPPWFDSLENGSTNWVVVDGEPGTTTWQLGQPSNGLESQAYSPTNAWGSNLRGNIIDTGDTTLASPGVQLIGGNKATLRFRHSYDFTLQSESDIYEMGQVYVSINNGNSWTFLQEYSDTSFGWEEAEIDLTPYIGHVVRIGFYYGLFTFESANKPGWLIDDISIAVTNVLPELRFTTIALTNGQARLTFTAPPNVTCVLERSTNLLNWIPLQTNVATGSEIIFTDAQSTESQFYRLRR